MSGLGGNTPSHHVVVDVSLDAGWSVGETMFGGALVRDMVAAGADAAGVPDWIALDTSARFVRPARPGAATVEVVVRHRGRSGCVAELTLRQHDRIAATALVTWGPPDAVPVLTDDGATPALPPADPGDGVDAAVARRVDWRVAGGWGPADGRLHSWIARRDEDGPATASLIPVAADLLVPALPGSRPDRPLRLASVALDIAVLAVPASRWLVQETAAERVGEASAHAVIRLTAPGGATVAHALHRARLLPAVAAEMPFSATAFGWGGSVDSSENGQTSGLS
jgi:hypothetical protein